MVGGSNIRLEGEVSNIAVKRRALQIAREIAGGKVEDRLLLRVERKRVDDELLQAVLHALTSEPAFRDFIIRPR